ncbi:MAG TPA: 3-hydroxyacyl-CoA dehydrogenase NAD-binding domain-containing protein [Gemmatimonadaceae bacterium]|nr:3-hydroxyacyl-CoA dehydrogenase NAD-binding domain-containing protein [Gemmatimonadaceae bacterium]
MTVPERVAIVGAGTIGSGWAALFAACGAEVRIFDADMGAERRARAALTDAVRAGAGVAHMGSVNAYVDLDDAVRGAEWVQESLPERLDLKRAMLGAVERALAPGAIVASSSSTFTATELAAGRGCADRLLVVHPLNPVYAVPVVEVSAGEMTAPESTARAMAVLRALGREPVLVRGAVPGLVANRLTAALLREAFDLVARGVVSAGELDRIVARGIALGWTAAGALGTEAIGAGGLAAFVERFAEPLARLWGSLADWQALTPERRAALLAAAREPGYGSMAHDTGDLAWAETLARIVRAAEGGDGEAA